VAEIQEVAAAEVHMAKILGAAPAKVLTTYMVAHTAAAEAAQERVGQQHLATELLVQFA
jgi:hypothetical protein